MQNTVLPVERTVIFFILAHVFVEAFCFNFYWRQALIFVRAGNIMSAMGMQNEGTERR